MNRTTRSTRVAGAVAVAGAAALALTTVGSAQADPTGVRVTEPPSHQAVSSEPYELLDAEDMPPAPTPWKAGPVTDGAGGERACVADLVPDDGSVHRGFSTELDTEGVQIVHEAASVREARQLTAELRAAVANCAERFVERYPEGASSERELGHLHAVQMSLPESSVNVHLLGVARSGTRVTVVQWGQMGTLDDAPVRDFRETLRAAVHGLR
ncbi:MULTISPECIES: hypothetical protein [unclassified Streptomyces]|uniref:hypothetical protein n=1 Tax=unclassified Streptomyces TaxID=2593676 RepID=UPI0022B5F8E0|nr:MULTISPECIES: hypothetical protein [unclassified Streptomyces]MCZ7417541.1 hypothetical protein [Streptomyces sp. WMMC897]MCZ7432630.1 hypothetical protein [Streptomyces sp. WMMC1477]